jgi:hypothetical protein
MIAGRVPLSELLALLAAERPVFHAEADFHQAFAWQLQSLDPTLRIRLETRPAPGVRLDLLVTSNDGANRSAVELKYLTRAWVGEVAGERFELKSQGAQDIRAYDVVKDVVRVEKFVDLMPGSNGAVVCLANDPSFWRTPTHGRDTNASAFRIYDGVRLEGPRAWGPNTGAGTSRNREEVLELRGAYDLRWRDYSTIPGAHGTVRALVVEVEPS